MSDADAATERLLRVGAFIRERARRDAAFTLDDVLAKIPEYAEAARQPRSTVRKRFRRDLDDLATQFGITVEYEESGHRYLVRPPFFTAAERRALIVAAVYAAVDPGRGPGRAEVGGAVDEEGAHLFLRVPPLVDTLRDAIVRGLPVAFRYAGRDRVLEPWALGMWRDRWYVAGLERGAGTARQFRLDAVESDLEPAGEEGSFAPPEDLDPDALFRFDPDAWGTDPPVPARVEVDADVAERLQRSVGGDLVAGSGGTAIVEAEVRNYDAFLDRVLEFGARARVRDPEALVVAMRERLSALAGASR